MEMRIVRGATLGLLSLTAACSSSSTTQNVIISPDGGVTAGGAKGTGGAKSVGGSGAPGGASNTGGTFVGGASGVAGSKTTGGTSSSTPGGTTSVGGSTSSVGGVSSTGGTKAITSGGGGSLTGGTSALGSATGGKTATGGASAIGGVTSSGLGGSAPVGGMSSTGGLLATGGVIGTGGKSAMGGAATGGAATGGVATGGAATGGAATGGAPTGGAATGGSSACSATTCGSSCVNLQSDSVNCGACGHDCLGGACLQGLCQPAAVTVTGNASGTAVNVLYVDDTNVYYTPGFCSPGCSVWRGAKTDLSGTGTQVLSWAPSYNSLVAGSAYWNLTTYGSGYQGTDIYTCSLAGAGCTTTSTPWMTSGGLVVWNASSTTQYLATVIPQGSSCLYNFCMHWPAGGGPTGYLYYGDAYTPASGDTASSTSFVSSGQHVYWITNEIDAQSNFVKALLFAVDTTTGARAQLAGGITQNSRILDANSVSVVLTDQSGALYRVPLPLGLGSLSPQSLGVQGVSAVEDASKFYWMDSQGTLYSCSSSNCAATATVLANGQSPGRIVQDSNAIYWGSSSPADVMRLAK